MPPIGATFKPIQPPAPAPAAATEYTPPNVTVKPAEGVQGKVGLYEVTVDGVTRFMTKKDAEDLLHVLAPAAPDDDEAISEPVQAPPGQKIVGQVAGLVVTTAAAPKAPPGTPRVVQGSLDPMSAASTMEMASRTGRVPTGLHQGSLSGINDMTLLAHAAPGQVNIEGVRMGPAQLADKLIDAGWRGGRLELVACGTGSGGSQSYAQGLANELTSRGAPTTVVAPDGMPAILGDAHGLPQIVKGQDANGVWRYKQPGEGWGSFVGKDEPGWHIDRSAARPGAWKGAAVGVAESAAFIGIGILHSHAVAERTRQEVERSGWSDPGPTGDKLYDIGAWIVDPGNEAGRSIPFQQRFDMDKWRQTMKDAADAKKPGEYYHCKWTTSDGHDIMGTPQYRSFEATYRKMADGIWRTESCKGCKGDEVPPDLNRIIDPKQSNEDIRKYLQLPAPWSDVV